MKWMKKGERPTTINRLKVLLDRLGIPCPEVTEIRRTYAGRYQRSCGAWSWYAVNSGGREIVASCDPLTPMLRKGAKVEHGLTSWNLVHELHYCVTDGRGER